MDELITRIQLVFNRLGEQLHTAMENADPGQSFLSVINVVLPVACGILRLAAVAAAVLIIVRCLLSLFREKPGKEIWGWLSMTDGTRLDLYHWENTIGRGRMADVTLNFPTISRSHATLLRDAKGNWKLQALPAKNGTRLNGKAVRSIVPLHSGDIVDLGGLPLEFYAISEEEEREQAMRWGVAERPLSPAITLGYLTLFQIMMCVQCFPGREWTQVASIAIAFAVLIASTWVMYMLYRALKRTAFEAETIAFFLCTLSFSITAAYAPGSLTTQCISVVAGIVLFLILSILLRDLRSTVSLRWPVAILTCMLLIFNVVLGPKIFGAKNWIDLGFISFQPSEFVKVAFIFIGAATLDRLFARRNLLFTVLFCGFCMGCLALMSDFGTALIFFVALLVIAFLRSGDIGFLALMVTAAAGGVGIILKYKSYIAGRFSAWRHVWEVYNDGGFQQTRTMSAIASGGLFGKGTEDSFLKDVFAANMDLVFGVVSEEFGLILALCVVFVLLVLTVYAIRCAATARSSYYVIAANAAAAMLISQASLNILGSVDILPLTGVTLPFVSMGGSSMIACWGLLAYIKAADTRPNASFTLKLPKRIRGWIPEDADQGYAMGEGYYDDDDYDDDDYYDGYDDDYGPEEDYDSYDDEYDDEYGAEYDEFTGYSPPPPQRDWQIEDSLNSRRDPGAWDDLLSGPLWDEDGQLPPDRERRRRP